MNNYQVVQDFGNTFEIKADSYAIAPSGALIFYGPTKSSSREPILALNADAWMSVRLEVA